MSDQIKKLSQQRAELAKEVSELQDEYLTRETDSGEEAREHRLRLNKKARQLQEIESKIDLINFRS